ncbi:hypothetical protein COOONC_22266 [Cooperia oncophora]
MSVISGLSEYNMFYVNHQVYSIVSLVTLTDFFLVISAASVLLCSRQHTKKTIEEENERASVGKDVMVRPPRAVFNDSDEGNFDGGE